LTALCAAACQKGPPPRLITLEAPEQIASGEAARLIVTITDTNGMQNTSQDDQDFVVEPEGLAKVDKKGFITCQKSGDGKVSLTIQGVTGTTDLSCRMVAKIEAADVGRVDLAGGPIEPKVSVVDAAGKELDDVKLTFSPKIPSVVKAKGLVLEPASVGNTEVVATAGTASATFTVEVVKKIEPEALPMDNNRRIDFSLPEGNWELKVTLKQAKPIKVRWRGADYCHYGNDAKTEHVAQCMLRDKGGVVFDNPLYLDEGSTEVGHKQVEIRQIP